MVYFSAAVFGGLFIGCLTGATLRTGCPCSSGSQHACECRTPQLGRTHRHLGPTAHPAQANGRLVAAVSSVDAGVHRWTLTRAALRPPFPSQPALNVTWPSPSSPLAMPPRPYTWRLPRLGPACHMYGCTCVCIGTRSTPTSGTRIGGCVWRLYATWENMHIHAGMHMHAASCGGCMPHGRKCACTEG